MSFQSGSLIRRRAVLVSVAGIVVIALAWWFAWMGPEGHKLVAVRQQQTSDQQLQLQLDLQLIALKAEAKQVHAAAPFLRTFEAAIPSSPDAPDLVVSVYNLATKDGVNLQSITDDSVNSSGLGYATVPVSLAVAGPHDAVLAFVNGLYGLSRLVTIQSVSLGGNGNLNASNSAAYTASISATAYTTQVTTTTIAGAS
jgi:type IV pilus assembly protein PilO